MKNCTFWDNLIELIDVNNKFEFESGTENPTKLLRKKTKNVPNLPGLYLVFTDRKSNLAEKSHLYFTIEGLNLELLYFGKAGGITNGSKILKQNLVGRINNVVNGDMPRAKYWTEEMLKNNESRFVVYYILNDTPSNLEKEIYNYFDLNLLLYPRMNKKLGRK
jgi:hypothetical protein